MKLKVLVDNTTLSGLYGEWGLSYYIEEGPVKVLFDVGHSDLFLKNGEKMKVDFLNLDYLVLSHGHHDHTWGMPYLIRHYKGHGLSRDQRPKMIGHEDVFKPKVATDGREVGCILSQEEMNHNFHLNLSKEPVWLSKRLVFLGEIEGTNDYEAKVPMGKIVMEGTLKDDYLLDDSAIVYQSEEGLVIITGCSHSGICNIIEHAKKVCNDSRIVDVIGGFHLIQTPETIMKEILDYMKNLGPQALHPCHCTDLNAKIALSDVAHVKQLGVGSELIY